jgi:bacterioferritin-associated ferredoxin
VYVCSCFGVTEAHVRACREAGADSPREVASACKAGTDCGSCVRRIQALLGRPAARQARETVPARAAIPARRAVADRESVAAAA